MMVMSTKFPPTSVVSLSMYLTALVGQLPHRDDDDDADVDDGDYDDVDDDDVNDGDDGDDDDDDGEIFVNIYAISYLCKCSANIFGPLNLNLKDSRWKTGC